MMADVKKEGPQSQEAETRTEVCAVQPGQGSHVSAQVDQVTEFDLARTAPISRVTWSSVLAAADRICQGLRRDLRRPGERSTASPRPSCNSSPNRKGAQHLQQILLWIDLDKGISVQQQFFTPQQDYRLAKYSSIQVNGKKIPTRFSS
jgi:hypothetical protein